MLKRIMCYFPNALDATSFHRGQGVMAELFRLGNIEINSHSKCNWAVIKGYDIVFFQRPFTEQHVDLIYSAKVFNKKIWIDFDDLLTDIPRSNYMLKKFDQKTITKSVLMSMMYADVVTVSTPYLKDELHKAYMEKFEGKEAANSVPEIVVIPNAIDDYLVNIEKTDFIRSKNRQKLIVWRGSDSHKEDLISHEDEIKKAISDNKDYQWLFIGYNPTFITNEFDNVKHQTALDIGMYYQYFKFINPLLFITPLEDIPLNRGKSNLVSLESAYAGAACIAPNWEEWQSGSNILYDDQVSLYDRICEVTKNCDKIQEVAQRNWEYVLENRLLSNVNSLRIEVVNKLMNK